MRVSEPLFRREVMPRLNVSSALDHSISSARAVAPTTSGSLPPLATITAGSAENYNGGAEQLELPSLMTGFGAFDGDSSDPKTAGGHLLSLEELLS